MRIHRGLGGWLMLTLSGCALAPATPPGPPPPTPAQMVHSIRRAAHHDDSVVQVHPVRDPAVQGWVDAAHRDAAAHRYAQAAMAMDKALKVTPKAPDLLQERAELAIRLGRFGQAEQLARRSYRLGPQVGALCVRNWQTLVELRRRAGDEAGLRRAARARERCRVRGPVRM